MRTVKVCAKVPERELAEAAQKAGMTDASRVEVARYCMLRLAGHDHDTAKSLALSVRSTADNSDEMRTIGVRFTEDFLADVAAKHPGMNMATLLRYSLAIQTADHEQALQHAQRKIGAPFKSASV